MEEKSSAIQLEANVRGAGLRRQLSSDKMKRRLSRQMQRRETTRARQSFGKRTLRATRSKLKQVAISYSKSRACMMFSTSATLTSCVFYIIGTYLTNVRIVVIFEAVFAVIFFTDYLLSLIATPVMSSYALSLEGTIDLLSVLPVFGAFRRFIYSFSFIRYLRLIKAIRITRNHRLVSWSTASDDATFKAALLGIKVTGLILMTTAIIYGTEKAVEETDGDSAFSDIHTLKWHDAFYFTIVTLSTVGYGDILPLQTFSRMLIVLVILFALTYVPLEVGHLVDVISNRPKHRKGFPLSLVGDQLHVILALVPSKSDDGSEGFNADNLGRCIDELFHEDHGWADEPLWVVVMAACPPSEEVQTILRSPRFLSRVIYYRGSVMDPSDMAAVCAEYADCIFLYPETCTIVNADYTEDRTTLAAKALQRYLDRTPVKPELLDRVERLSVTGTICRTVVTVRELSSKDQLLRFGIDHVICHDELKMAMLACGTLCPAFLPFVINAMRSTSSDAADPRSPTDPRSSVDRRSTDKAQAPKTNQVVLYDEQETNWLDDYKQGMGYEIYSMPLQLTPSSALYGKNFKEAAQHLYDASNGEVLLMAVVNDVCVRGEQVQAGGNVDMDVSVRRSDGNMVTSPGARAPSGGGGGGSDILSNVFPRAPPVAPAPTLDSSDVPSGRLSRGQHRNDSVMASHRRRRSVTSRGLGGDRSQDPGASRHSGSSHVITTIFPDDDFKFTRQCYVLVLAEDKQKAENHMLALQESVTPNVDDSGMSATQQDMSQSADPTLNPIFHSDNSELEPKIAIKAAVVVAGTAAAISPARKSNASSAQSSPRSTTDGGSRRPASKSMQTEEERAKLESVRQEMRKEEGMHWKEALEALKSATKQLKELEGDGEDQTSMLTETRVAENPAEFFGKVEKAQASISFALKVHTAAIPEDLNGHLVLVGSHPRLQHYVLAIRRQRPHVPLVMVTKDESLFFELRERLVERKCQDPALNISRIYHVFGKTQDTSTFDEAKIQGAEAVVLMSDQPDDSEVLLISFELEQLLSEMELGESTPKVLIDLRKDGSIYYCGHNLSRGGPGTSSSYLGVDSGQLQELSQGVTDGSSPAGVWEWPLFAAGRVWTESIMDVVAVQTFFSAEILAFFETLLQIRRPFRVGRDLYETTAAPGDAGPEASNMHGGSASNGSSEDDEANPAQRGQFDQLKISHRFHGRTYGHLVRSLVAVGAMPIGLYRPAGTKGSTLPYTHVNPSPDEPLQAWPKEHGRAWGMGSKRGRGVTAEGDSVFVLRSKQCRIIDYA